MIISRARSFVFVHIPKTGGTSLALALEDRAANDDILIGDTPKAVKRRARLKSLSPRGRLWKHATLADIDGIITPDDLAQMFTFCLVRNPWDRMVSYYHWLQDQSFDHPAVALAKSADFPTFLRDDLTINSFRAAPARHYMTDAQGTERASLYIRLEHFAADSAPLWDRLGFTLALPHENKSARGDYRCYYDSALADHLGHICAEDIARFGYSFE